MDANEGPKIDLSALKETITNDWTDDTEALLFLAVEVSEKRLRHWVRLPFACGLTLVGLLTRAEVTAPSPRLRLHKRSAFRPRVHPVRAQRARFTPRDQPRQTFRSPPKSIPSLTTEMKRGPSTMKNAP